METFELIHTYSRAQAIADGVLVDLTDARDPRGHRISPFKWPVAITQAAFDAAVATGGRWVSTPEGGEALELPGGQEAHARIIDLLQMLKHRLLAIVHATPGERIKFGLLVDKHGNGRTRFVHLVCVPGPGDQGEPTFTIMLPTED
jgi:hypothetical protein